MPLVVYALGLAIFAQGTSELMLAGLLTAIAGDLGVTVPRAGLLISAFAIGMLFGAPILAILTARWSRRAALLTFMAIFVAAHIVAALTDSYAVLFGTRVVAAFVYAGFWSVAAAGAVAAVPATARARAMSVVAGGLTLASVVGLPLGTWAGQLWGWRSAFWGVAVASGLVAFGVLIVVPHGRPAAPPRVRTELRALATGPVVRLYGTTMLATGAGLAVFGYLGALLTTTTRLPAGWVPVVLGGYGVGMLLGVLLGGRVADAHPTRTLAVGVTGLVLTAAALAGTAHHAIVVIPLVFLLGVFGFVTNPVLNSRVFLLAPAAPTLAAAGNVVSFNVGITVGPWLGGLALGAGFDYPVVAWICVALATAALGVVGWSAVAERHGPPGSAADIPASVHDPCAATAGR
ncbi:Cmx/CmrA family chloramphenicol efflux MFS transporter [Nocardia sp. alder85J]|uniref:Cmx/CmrA family chloramphenicol efflux MFS transporter n=1 Tax=Nocardia sp. alder85J TaxID=2862949 RepID=UPI001CD62746|nr:Cmx/CmrA family chloramphenicol efflux MFS transporter [Nocardia sp. alder85J]MCX4096450.1 MFS transporter [Nocardia sp. alder85J]